MSLQPHNDVNILATDMAGVLHCDGCQCSKLRRGESEETLVADSDDDIPDLEDVYCEDIEALDKFIHGGTDTDNSHQYKGEYCHFSLYRLLNY